MLQSLQQNVAEKSGEIQKVKKEKDVLVQKVTKLEEELKKLTEDATKANQDASSAKQEVMKIKMGQKLANQALEDELKR